MLNRADTARVVELGDALCLVGADGTVRRVDGDSAALVRRVLALLATPIEHAALVARIGEEAGVDDATAIVDQALALLTATGAVRRTAAPVPMERSRGRVVVGICGAIGAVEAPALVLALQRRGFTVEVALTRAAARFVSAPALSAIAQREVHRSIWPATPRQPVPHVALAAWADLVVVYPATATTIGRIAGGDFSDLVAAIALTTRAPVLVAPAMNPAMAAAPAVVRNLARLRDDGFAITGGVPAVEVADAPSVRAPVGGGAPPAAELAATIDALWRGGALARRAPRAGIDWDAVHATHATDDGRLPWVSDACDDDLAAALAAHATPPGPLLDVGCGLGQVTRHAAAAGFQVVATDVSEVALALARARGPAGVIWLRDDIAATSLAGGFAAVVDRGCLHVLPRARHAAWAQAMRRLVEPGGVLIVKAHRPGAPYATAAFTAEALAALVGDGFTPLAITESTMPGARAPAPAPALLGVFRRPWSAGWPAG